MVHFWFLDSKIRGFHYLGHFDLVDRSFDIMCLHFWIRSYSDLRVHGSSKLRISFLDFLILTHSWHIVLSLLLYLKFKRALYQLVFPSTIFASPFCNLPRFSPTFGDNTGYGIVVCEMVRESGNSQVGQGPALWHWSRIPEGILLWRNCSYQHIECTSFDAGGQGYKLLETCHL